jgi:hypothetical protein
MFDVIIKIKIAFRVVVIDIPFATIVLEVRFCTLHGIMVDNSLISLPLYAYSSSDGIKEENGK